MSDQSWKNHLRVIPVTFTYYLTSGLTLPGIQQLVYDKHCYQQYPNEYKMGLCNNASFSEHHAHLQKQSSITYLSLIAVEGILACLASLYVGLYCDNIGTKMPMIVSITGQLIEYLSLSLQAYYIEWPMFWLFISYAIYGCCGSFVTLLMSVYCLLSRSSSNASRSTLLSAVEGLMPLGNLLSQFSSGFIMTYWGTVWIFIVSSFLCAIGLFSSTFFVMDMKPRLHCPSNWEDDDRCQQDIQTQDQSFSEKLNENAPDCRNSLIQNTPVKQIRWWHLFSKIYWAELLRFFTEGFENGGKLGKWLAIWIYSLAYLNIMGSAQVFYYYLTKYLGFSQVEFSYFTAVRYSVGTLVAYFNSLVLGKLLAFKDSSILILNFAMAIVSLYSFGISNVYIASLWVGLAFYGCLYPSLSFCKSIVSKMVGKKDTGKAFCLIFSLEAIFLVLSAFLYNGLYSWSVSFYPGLCFLVGAGCAFIALTLSVIISFLYHV